MTSLSLRIPNLSKNVEIQLENMILSGIFWPKSTLPSERRLAQEMDVSRTSVRNALAGLCEKKMIIPVNRGYHVNHAIRSELMARLSSISENQPTEIFVFWASLAEDILAIAKLGAMNSDRVAVSIMLDSFRNHFRGNNVRKFISAHKMLWKTISEATYNPFIGQTMDALTDALEPVFIQAFEAINNSAEFMDRVAKVYEPLQSMCFDAAQVIDNYNPVLRSLKTTVKSDLSNSAGISDDLKALNSAILRQPHAFEAIFALRLLTEKRAAQWAARNITETGKKQLSAQLLKMSLVVDDDWQTYSAMDTQLHILIAKCSANPVSSVLYECLNPIFTDTTDRWLKTHFDHMHDHSIIHFQHQKVVTAILDKDENQAGKNMEKHLSYALETLNQLRLQQHHRYIAHARKVFR